MIRHTNALPNNPKSEPTESILALRLKEALERAKAKRAREPQDAEN